MEYIKKILYRIRHFIITLKFSILFIFISLFMSASIILILISYISSSNDIIHIENQAMKQTTDFLSHLLINEIKLAEHDAKITSSLIENNLLDVNNMDEMMSYFYLLAEQSTLIQSISWGDVNGNFVTAEYKNDDSMNNFYINRNIEPAIQMLINRNSKGDILKYSRSKASLYDPRKMQWFLTAVSNKKSVWTDVYLPTSENYLGITLATPIYNSNNKLKSVLGLNLRLDWISWYINHLKITPRGILFIVQLDGKLIAYPKFDTMLNHSRLVHINDIPSKWITDSFYLYTKTKNESFSFIHQGEKYLASYYPILTFQKQGWVIGIVIPEQDLISEITSARTTNIIISILTLLLGIFLVSKFVNNIVNPVKSLIKETDKIKNFDLEGNVAIHSRIKEIILLSNAIYTMKIGLNAFKHYVPSALVKQLIKKGESAKLGGSKKTIVAFFSDIRDFTEITHISNSNLLMMQLNEYFEALSSIIIHEGGTIDKYIGDSIMAFWGAPDEFQNPCHHAANAALKIISEIDILNKKWNDEGKYPFDTHIGIHIGEAIVGNLGSTERINYTAIGETINIASRIEGINKQFDTNILVSKAVYELIKNHFMLEEVGFVKLKGLSKKIYVYALIAHRDEKSDASNPSSIVEHF